ncbi:MAG TPA: SLBB domain-containing protein [Terracidiphilus sp.]|nr:SLBB domain-containing protein [Terracidiphilus sp.]
MKSWLSGSQSGVLATGSDGSMCVLRVRMVKSSLLFLALLSSGAVLLAQQNPGSQPDGAQSPVDCSDPLQAESSQCANQSPSQNGQNLEFPLPTTQPGNPNLGLGPDQSRGLTRTYSDAESQLRRNLNQQRSVQTQPPLPPEPLTEFQKFTASTTGQILPIFGASLFRNVPSTFAPLDLAPVPPDYIIGPGDELRIRVWGQVNFQANVQVDRAGEIYIPIPQIGPVHVAGISYSDLNQHVREAIARVYRNFDLIADIGQIRAVQVYVTGEARRPGVYTVSSLSTLIDALFASGGPSVQGSLRHIQVKRGAETVTDFDLYSFLIHGDKSKDVKLSAGDVIFIPPAGQQVAITGSVRNPAIYELLANDSVANVIADAGGVSATAAQTRLSIERIEDHNQRHAMEVAYDSAGLATPLAGGDLVRVFSIVPKYTETVTLRGNIANPGRFAWHPGMRISDLIPDKDSLITRNYWWRRAQLGLPAPEFEPTPGFDRLRQPREDQPITLPRIEENPAQRELMREENNQSSPQMQEASPQYDQDGQSGRFESPRDQNGLQQPGLTAQQRSSASSLAAQESQRGYSRTPAGAQRTDVYLPAPEIDWDYADILRMDPATLKTTVIPFDLGKLVLEHDQAQNLELQAGDVISIFSEADIHLPIAHQTKFVRLEGEFAHAGLYTVRPGETLRDLVERAGGLTPNAYLYGAEFTRESTRLLQQARIDEYVQSLDLRIQRASLALSSSPVSSAQDIASANSAQASERELLGRLHQMRASGRIVLEFTPASAALNDIPTLALEDGDKFAVPSLPATVNVVGAVNDQNSFLYSRDRRLGTYLKKAGGETKDADRKRSFVIRADGEVVGYDSTRNAWGSGFENLRINPGDTIVIPEKTFRPSALRGVLDWSQVFSQFALGAAAISVIQ